MVTAADEKMYLQDDPSEKCRLQEICGKGYPGKNSHGEIVCFTGGCKFDTRARGPVEQRKVAFKIVESIPDKNGIVIIGIKEDRDGMFVSRDKALEYLQYRREHDAEVAARVTAQLTAQHEQELRHAVEGARNGERGRVLKLVCVECPVRNEEMPLEDYCAESCEGCLINKVISSLRSSNPGEQEQRAEHPPSMPEGGTDVMR